MDETNPQRLMTPYGAETYSPKFDETGRVVRRAVGTAEQALAIAKRLYIDDEKMRDEKRARVFGAYDGNPPYALDDQKSEGNAWAFNLSFGYMEGVMGRFLAPFLRLAGTPDKLGSMLDGDILAQKLHIIREEFVSICQEWGKWPKFYSRWITELGLHGWACVMFPSVFDPWPIFAPQNRTNVPNGSGNDVKDIEIFSWRTQYRPHELFDQISDEQMAQMIGWNVANTRDAITKAEVFNIITRRAPQSWEETEKLYREGSLASSLLGEKEIAAYHVFVPELADAGAVTHWIIWDTDHNKSVELFKKEARFATMDECLVYADIEAGDGKWHGPKGVGRKAYNTHAAIDRLRCEMLNQAFLSGLMPFQVENQSDVEELELTVLGRACILPAGLRPIADLKIPSLSREFMMADALLTRTGEQRFGDVVPSEMSVERPAPKTATQSTIDAQMGREIQEAQLIRFVDPLGKVLSNIVRRLCIVGNTNKYAQMFQQRCQKRGITPEDFERIVTTKAFGQIGQVLGREQQGNQLALQTFRGDPDIQQLPLKKRFLNDLLPEQAVEELMPQEQDKTQELEAQRKQQMETSSMKLGGHMLVSPRDNHVPEAQDAIGWLAQEAAKAKQGQPVDLAHIQAVMLHTQGHLAAMEQDESKRSYVADAENALRQIEAIFRPQPSQPQALAA